MDKQSLGYLDFKQSVLALGIVCSSRVTEKLKLLYILHLPPLLHRSEIDVKTSACAAPEEAEEVATEAEDFFGYANLGIYYCYLNKILAEPH